MEGLLMKKYIGLFIIVGMLASSGVASADRGFWFSSNAAGWSTWFNVVNTGASQAATVQFFDIFGASLGSTSTTLGTNAAWNFSTDGVGNITVSTLEAGTRGIAIITGVTAGEVRGYSSIFSTSGQSGFNLRLKTTAADDSDVDWGS